MKTTNGRLAKTAAIGLCAAAALTMMTESAFAWRGGCWGCGRGAAFAAGAIAGAAIAAPYVPPRYYYGGPAVVVAPPPVVVAPAPVYSYTYPTCPVVGPMPYYCR